METTTYLYPNGDGTYRKYLKDQKELDDILLEIRIAKLESIKNDTEFVWLDKYNAMYLPIIDNLIINSNVNIGLGTIAPYTKLHVYSNTQNKWTII